MKRIEGQTESSDQTPCEDACSSRDRRSFLAPTDSIGRCIGSISDLIGESNRASDSIIPRRRFMNEVVAATGLLATVSLAGCSGEQSTGPGENADSDENPFNNCSPPNDPDEDLSTLFPADEALDGFETHNSGSGEASSAEYVLRFYRREGDPSTSVLRYGIIRYESQEEALDMRETAALSPGSAEEGEQVGHVVAGNWVFGVRAENEDTIRTVLSATPALSDDCVSSAIVEDATE